MLYSRRSKQNVERNGKEGNVWRQRKFPKYSVTRALFCSTQLPTFHSYLILAFTPTHTPAIVGNASSKKLHSVQWHTNAISRLRNLPNS